MNFETNNRTEPYPIGTELVIVQVDHISAHHICDVVVAVTSPVLPGRIFTERRVPVQWVIGLHSRVKSWGREGTYPIAWMLPTKPDEEELTQESLKVVTDYLETV